MKNYFQAIGKRQLSKSRPFDSSFFIFYQFDTPSAACKTRPLSTPFAAKLPQRLSSHAPIVLPAR